MSYMLVTKCDTCGATHEIPMGTLVEIEDQAAIFAMRVLQVRAVGAPDDMPVATQCGECGDKPVPPGAARIRGADTIEVTGGSKN